MRLLSLFLLLLLQTGTMTATTFFTGMPIENLQYHQKIAIDSYRYGFNGQMKDNEWAGKGNHYSAEFWEYNSQTASRLNKDDWDNNASVSSYSVFDRNPIWKSDPLGNVPSTDVTKEDDGTYKVVGGKDDGDKNIYVVDKSGKRTGEVMGQSLTPNSFLGDNGKPVVGAIINPSDQSGINFLNNEIRGDNPALIHYIPNATGGKNYDFKTRGMPKGLSQQQRDQYKYRGMPVGRVKGLGGGDKPTFASGRDIGNVGAGFIAGRNGLTWGEARLGFDALESKQNGRISTEGAPTQNAENVGFHLGVQQWLQDHPVINLFNSRDVFQSYPPR